jgi:hypothetical protein
MATDAPPTLRNDDTGIDRDWFTEHRGRTCYARRYRDTDWILIVKRIAPPARPGRPEHPIMLRVWDRGPHVPDSETACLTAWKNAAYPKP